MATHLTESWQTRLGRAIRAARRSRGWSREKLAELAGYDVQAVQKVERGRGVRFATFCDIAEAVGLELPAQLGARA